mmetsp:Transcript_10666/g.15960  ORF Transcript_10666/g.15960 Transcript_10666/m.15960 type:complete len:159 (-) Transcript_10666:56-532(-)
MFGVKFVLALLFSFSSSFVQRNIKTFQLRTYSANQNSFDDEELIEGAKIVKKLGRKYVEYVPKDNRDRLPYDVYTAWPPQKKVGRFSLSPCTGCGDMIHHNANTYIIRRVTCHYKFKDGSYKMFKKEAHATELFRAATERIAEKMFQNSNPLKRGEGF